MKINLKKMGAIVAGATLLASSAAFATVMFGDTTLVDENGAPVAKVVLGGQSQPSDGVAAGLIAGSLAGAAYKSQTLTAEVAGTATCTGDGEGEESGTCSISNEKARLEITIPGTVAAGTWTGENLIGDYLNRELLDRENNYDTSDSDQAYEGGGSDTSENANPFTDGVGGFIGPSEEYLYQIGAGQLSTFQPLTVTDTDAGNTYVEMQSIWIQGDNRFDSDPDDVVGNLEFVAYTLKFDGPGGEEIGIPVCTDSEDNDYTYCKGADGDIDDATETHRLEIQFLGEPWIISEMNAPNYDPDPSVSGDGLVNENQLVEGGSIKLAKESIGGILNQGESLEVDDLKFQLDDLEAHGETTAAIISVLDANDNILEKDKVMPGNTKEMNVNGKEYRFHVYKVAPGYTFGAKWADVAIFSHEIECADGEELDSDEDTNPNYECALGWKNLDASSGVEVDGNPEAPDALRTVIIFSDDVEDISTSGESTLEEGDSITIVEDPAAWVLSYKGLDLTSEDRYSLKFEIKTSDKEISASKGPIDSGTWINNNPGEQVACTIYAPYVEVSSAASGSVFEIDGRSDGFGGSLSDNEFLVAVNSAAPNGPAACDDDTPLDGVDDAAADYVLPAGSVFMHTSSSSSDYGVVEYAPPGLVVKYDDIGDGDNEFTPQNGGAIAIQEDGGTLGPGDSLMGDLMASHPDYSGSTDNTPMFMFGIAEKAGTGSSNEYVDYWLFGVADTDTGTPGDATFDFDSDDGSGDPVTSSDEEVLYGHATSKPIGTAYDGAEPVSGPVDGGLEMVEEGYISERGSVFESIDDDRVEFDMAHKLARAQWWLGPTETAEAGSSAHVVTLGEGESTTIGGVTVKVLEITEDVGACSAEGGAASCTADMSPVSAVIMPNNAASVDVMVPYTGEYGDLVIFDSDAVGVNTLISVGGDRVNSISAAWLADSPVDWTTETKVVQEMEAGKILVAGAEKEQTLEAAKDFISQLQKA